MCEEFREAALRPLLVPRCEEGLMGAQRDGTPCILVDVSGFLLGGHWWCPDTREWKQGPGSAVVAGRRGRVSVVCA